MKKKENKKEKYLKIEDFIKTFISVNEEEVIIK